MNMIAGEDIEQFKMLYIRKDGKLYMTADNDDECIPFGMSVCGEKCNE